MCTAIGCLSNDDAESMLGFQMMVSVLQSWTSERMLGQGNLSRTGFDSKQFIVPVSFDQEPARWAYFYLPQAASLFVTINSWSVTPGHTAR